MRARRKTSEFVASAHTFLPAAHLVASTHRANYFDYSGMPWGVTAGILVRCSHAPYRITSERPRLLLSPLQDHLGTPEATS